MVDKKGERKAGHFRFSERACISLANPEARKTQTATKTQTTDSNALSEFLPPS
jgi:hypothetical protein